MFLIIDGFTNENSDSKSQSIVDTTTGYVYRLLEVNDDVRFTLWTSLEDYTARQRSVLERTGQSAMDMFLQLATSIDRTIYASQVAIKFFGNTAVSQKLSLDILGLDDEGNPLGRSN